MTQVTIPGKYKAMECLDLPVGTDPARGLEDCD